MLQRREDENNDEKGEEKDDDLRIIVTVTAKTTEGDREATHIDTVNNYKEQK